MVKNKELATETDKTTKKQSKNKKSKAVKTYENLGELKPITQSYTKILLDKVKLNMIKTGEVQKVYIEDEEYITLSLGWIELCIVLLGAIYISYKDAYLNTLVKHKILSSDFEVTSIKKKTFEINNQTKAYKIINTEFYLYTNLNPKTINKAIIGMFSAIGIKKDQVKLDVYPLGTDDNTVKLTERDAVIKTKRINIVKCLSEVQDGASIKTIEIEGTKYNVQSFYDAVMKFMEWVEAQHGEQLILKAQKYNKQGIGISEKENINCIDIQQIPLTSLYLYYNNNKKDCIEFIHSLCFEFNINTSMILLEVTQLYVEGE